MDYFDPDPTLETYWSHLEDGSATELAHNYPKSWRVRLQTAPTQPAFAPTLYPVITSGTRACNRSPPAVATDGMGGLAYARSLIGHDTGASGHFTHPNGPGEPSLVFAMNCVRSLHSLDKNASGLFIYPNDPGFQRAQLGENTAEKVGTPRAFFQCDILHPEPPDKEQFGLQEGLFELDISVTTESDKAALGSQESHRAPPCTHVSDGSSSGTSAGDSRPSISAQPSCTSAQSSPYPFAYQSNEDSEPEWDGSGLQASVARNNDNVEEELPVLSHVNPKRGSTSGGEEIYLIVRNLPPTATPYARFGCNIAPTSHIANGILACRLPPATHPGVVAITLCQAPSIQEKCYGTSLVSFEYEANTSKAVALVCKLKDLEVQTPFTGAMPKKLLQRSTTDPIHPAPTAPSSLPESTFLEVLAFFKSLPDFEQRLSTVNEYGQSLLHLAVYLRYRELVQRLVDWGIDLNIKDVNGFTALHSAYHCGDSSITHSLEQRGGIQLSLDILGRPPIELASGAMKAPEDKNLQTHIFGHFEHEPFACSGQ